METKLKKADRKSLEKIGTKIEPITSSTLQISITTDVVASNLILSGKKVELVTFPGGSQALLIDGILYNPEIMIYHNDEETGDNTELNLVDIGFEVVHINGATIEQIKEEE